VFALYVAGAMFRVADRLDGADHAILNYIKSRKI